MRAKKLRKDYPDGVISIFDNGGKTIDRYTVVYTPHIDYYGESYFEYLTMSTLPFHPQGVCQHSGLLFRPLKNTNEKIINFVDLPEDCQKVVFRDVKGE